jgi:RNA polymerase sigma factor (sigma-70 family)
VTPERIVHIVDDEPDVLASVAWLLRSAGIPSRCYSSAHAFLSKIDTAKRGCLLLDVRMPGMDGMTLIEELAGLDFRLPIILISAHATVRLTVDAMQAGVVNVLEKPYDDDMLLSLVNEALAQDDENQRRRAETEELAARLETLTKRERSIMELVVEGLPSKQIAERLDISPSTVDVHRCHLMEKLGVSTAAQLVRLVLSHRARGTTPSQS